MEVLSSRVLLHPRDLALSQHFYRDVLGLAVYREFGSAATPGLVFFLGGGALLEVSAGPPASTPGSISLWLQVRDVRGEHDRLLAAGVTVTRAPRLEPWGLIELWIADPDGVALCIVEVPADHPLRRDQR